MLQFTISVVLILGTVIVRSQLQFMQSEKLGLDKEHVLVIHGNADIGKRLNAFDAAVKKISGVQDVMVDLAHERVIVTFDARKTHAPDLHDAILKSGYKPGSKAD